MAPILDAHAMLQQLSSWPIEAYQAGETVLAGGTTTGKLLVMIEGVVEVRCGTGALAAVQLADPPTAMALAKRLRSFGVATRAIGAGGIQVSPPFVMTDDQVGDLADAVRAALAA